MKKYIYSSFLLMSLLLTSCDNFLSVESPDKLTTKKFWRDKKDAESAIAAAYSQLEYSVDTWAFAEVKWPVEAYREDIITLGNDAMNYPNWVELSTFSYTNGNSQVTEYWKNNYDGINFCNQILENVPKIDKNKIDDASRAQILGEAHFLRAYYHLKLLLNWEKIVIRDKFIAGTQDLKKPVSERVACWDAIVSDLKQSLRLPARYDADNVGRATSGAAYSYLGFAYLTRAYEEKAKKEEYLGQALEAFEHVKGYELEEKFSSMFSGVNKNCKESVFELQFSMNTASGANYRTQFHKWIASSELGGWDEILPSQILISEFEKEGMISTQSLYDKRMYETLFFDTPFYNDGKKKVFGSDYKDKFGTSKRTVFRKMLPSTQQGMDQNYCAINIPLMRYANVMLFKAEVLNALGRSAEAIPLINEIRKVHGNMPPMKGSSPSEVMAQIEHERMIEFPLENWRWYDLRRWGKLTQAMSAAKRSGFNESKNSFYPLPLKEVLANQ
ncbi:RagB/SusD family nutrient uptake outer membrane protein [Porphyromonas pogonae]|uniref:RagB/SusD family nutrient uptake outer membrane protein n=1 Tax=Porphyromonas pogonae TaxID=867595 RepID=UPI002E77082A|nr:RagB/SusD family nutrient uptake outer membrane protein [Porphyromonas pogonae]